MSSSSQSTPRASGANSGGSPAAARMAATSCSSMTLTRPSSANMRVACSAALMASSRPVWVRTRMRRPGV